MTPVLFVTTVLAPDGAGRALEALAGALARRYSITVCSLTHAAPAMCAHLARAGVRVETLHMRGRLDGAVAWRLAALCRRLEPAVLHTQLSRADWIGRLVASAVRQTIVLTTIQNVHSEMYRAEFGWKGAVAGRALDRCTSSLSNHFVAVSRGVAEDTVASGVARARVSVIPNGVDLSRRQSVLSRGAARAALGLDAGETVVGCSALLKPQKGLADLADAVELLSARGVRATFVVLGDGPLRGALEARAARLAAGPARLCLAGWRDDAMAWMPAFDLFVLPSRWEGLPVALVEAMSLGIAAIGTRVSGIEDVIEDCVTGWLVEPADPRGLADRLACAAASPAARARIGEAGRAAVETRFSADVVAAAHHRLYQALLQEKGTGPFS